MVQSLSEAGVLCGAGAIGGLVLAQLRIERFNEALRSAPMIPFWLDVRLDHASLLVVLGLTIFASLMSGTLPAVQASRTPLAETLKSESGASVGPALRRFSQWLVILEIGLSCGILVGAGLMIRTIVELDQMNFAFSTKNILTMHVTLDYAEYPDKESRAAFANEVVTRLKAKPGVEDVALTSHLPGVGSGGASFILDYSAESPKDRGTVTGFAEVSSSFFDTFEVGLVAGRPFQSGDDLSSTRVAIVNQGFVDRYLPGESPLGRRLRLFGLGPEVQDWTIVGLAPDMAMNRRRPGMGFVDGDSAGLYVPLAQNPNPFLTVAVRTNRPPMSLAQTVRSEIEAIAPGQAVFDINGLDRVIEDQNVYYWLISEGFSVLGVSALFLASIGLYGIMASSVNRRRREIGVRVAMGAQPRSVLLMILKQGLFQMGIGIALGLLIAVSFAGTLEVTLFEVDPWDPLVFSSIPLVLFAAGLVACIVPARRATRIDPVAALREE